MSTSLGFLGHRSDQSDQKSLGLRVGSLLVPKRQLSPLGGPKARLPPYRMSTEVLTRYHHVGTEAPTRRGLYCGASAEARA